MIKLVIQAARPVTLIVSLGASCAPQAAQPPLAPVPSTPGHEQERSAFILPPVPKPPGDAARDGATRVLVRQVVFHGNTVFPDEALRAIAAPYVGRSLGALELEALRRALTLHYVNHGYVNSGALLDAAQAPRDGVLHVTLMEGVVSQMRLAGLERLSEDYLVARLVPDPLAPLNIDDLRERYQLLLADPLFDRVTTRLIPDLEQGRAILDVDVARARPYQFSVFANNDRPPSIGEGAIGASGLVRNLTGYGDTLSVNLERSPRSAASDRYGMNWALPINRHGTQLTLQFDRGSSSVREEPLDELGIQSRLSSAEIGLRHPLIETLRHRLAVGASWSDRTNRTALLGDPYSFTAGIPDGVLNAKTWKIWQDYSFRTESNVFVARITRNEVRDNLSAPPAGAGGPNTQAPGRYGYWLTQLHFGQRVTQGGAQFQARATIQDANNRLISLDGMSIGGNNTVRGYRENQLLRDKGGVLNLELDVPILGDMDSRSPRLGVMPFFDWGTGHNIGESAAILSSAGLALHAGWRGIAASLAVARRLIRPLSADALHGTYQDRGVHFQVSYNF